MASPGNRHCARCIGTLSLPFFASSGTPNMNTFVVN